MHCITLLPQDLECPSLPCSLKKGTNFKNILQNLKQHCRSMKLYPHLSHSLPTNEWVKPFLPVRAVQQKNHTEVYWPCVCHVHWIIRFLVVRDYTSLCSWSCRDQMNICWSEAVFPSASLFSLFPLKTFPPKLLHDAWSMLLSPSDSKTLTFGSRILLTLTLEYGFSSGFKTLRSSNPWSTQH